MRTDVAVLYVDPRGPYPKLVADWYDEKRDARLYRGPLPVVAHPPCGPWGRLKAFNKYQLPELALLTVPLVRVLGGALEHPAHSTLWDLAGLPRPNALPDACGGWTLDVDQCRFGHVAQKLTWIYIVGCAREDLPPFPSPRQPEAWVCGGRTGERPATRRKASAAEGRLTPPPVRGVADRGGEQVSCRRAAGAGRRAMTKRLEEIESKLARLKKPDGHVAFCSCERCVDAVTLLRDLWETAPADLALLARLVRMVAEAGCETLEDRGYSCQEATASATIAEPWTLWCWPCRVRRESEAGR